MTEQCETETAVATGKGGKYLTLALADEEYGLEILKVREIINMMEITSVPCTPRHVKGVINLRGKVIPVVDLRLKVGMPEAERTGRTCIIVVDIGEVEMGIIVDRVSEVLDIADEDIEDAPSFGAQVNTDYIVGMGKFDDRVTILLDISKLLTQTDMSILEAAVGSDHSTCDEKADRECRSESSRDQDERESLEQPEQERQEQSQGE